MTVTTDPDFYDRTALWWGRSAVTAADRDRARQIDNLPAGPHVVLELGAGFGGAAAATTDLGHTVVAVERSAYRAALARRHVREGRANRLEVVEADFMALDLPRRFDVVAYWSGFGVGSDADQRLLLRRIRTWLRPGGVVLLDVFDPEWWAEHDGESRTIRGMGQRIAFDAHASRLVVVNWLAERPTRTATESVRCYAREEMLELVAGSGLRAIGQPAFEPGSTLAYQMRLTTDCDARDRPH